MLVYVTLIISMECELSCLYLDMIFIFYNLIKYRIIRDNFRIQKKLHTLLSTLPRLDFIESSTIKIVTQMRSYIQVTPPQRKNSANKESDIDIDLNHIIFLSKLTLPSDFSFSIDTFLQHYH